MLFLFLSFYSPHRKGWGRLCFHGCLLTGWSQVLSRGGDRKGVPLATGPRSCQRVFPNPVTRPVQSPVSGSSRSEGQGKGRGHRVHVPQPGQGVPSIPPNKITRDATLPAVSFSPSRRRTFFLTNICRCNHYFNMHRRNRPSDSYFGDITVCQQKV